MISKLSFILITSSFISLLLVGCQSSSQSERDSIRKSDLIGTKWQLTKLTLIADTSSDNIEFNDDVAPILEFRDELVGGNSGCNTYRAGWKLGQDGRFALSGPISSTRKGCLDTVMTLEQQYIEVFAEVHTIIKDGSVLILSSSKGELIFADAK